MEVIKGKIISSCSMNCGLLEDEQDIEKSEILEKILNASSYAKNGKVIIINNCDDYTGVKRIRGYHKVLKKCLEIIKRNIEG